MPSPEQLFQQLLKKLRPTLVQQGFRRKGQNFVAESPECWGLINFQKSIYSPATEKNFTVNLAIAAKRVMLFYEESIAQAPRYYASHWVIRIGELIPEHRDRWWTLSTEASYGPIASAVEKHICELAAPIIRTHLTEEGLIALWNSKHFGGFEYPILKYKSILFAERGEFEKLPAIFERILEICHGGPAQVGADEHIAHMRRRYHQIQ